MRSLPYCCLSFCSSSCFHVPCGRGEADHLSYCCTARLLFPSIGLCCWSFPSTFLCPFLDLSSGNPPIANLSCGHPRFLQVRCFFVSVILVNLPSLILTMCPAHLIRLFTILPTKQALVPTSSLRSYIILLSTIFAPAADP